MLDVRRMQVLRAVVSSGSVTAAATNLGYTPSAVSQQIAALERQVGLPLLERVGRGVRPTAAGWLLTEHAAIIAKYVAEAETALADLRAGRTGLLAIRYFATAGAALVPPALAKWRAEFPGVQVDLKLIDPGDPLPEVVRGQADLAIVVSPRDQPADGIRLVHLLDDPYHAVLPKGHPLTAKRVVDLADMADEPWVSNELSGGRCQELMLSACASAGFTPNFIVESDDYATAQGLVAAGLGVTLIPGLGLGQRHPAVVVRRVRNPEPVRSIYAAVRETSLARPALAGLLDALRDVATQ
ncbi:LysR family transcriptional regulator [Actinophytocola sp.]|uniref:LysR family transcriptional regulator n=1 Tax=Actinophytocola sp. TaxID=1872138 RepID=UPI002ED06759